MPRELAVVVRVLLFKVHFLKNNCIFGDILSPFFMSKLRRTTGSRAMLFGICGGIASFFDIDRTLVRILWVIATIFGFGSPILIYLILVLVIPKENNTTIHL